MILRCLTAFSMVLGTERKLIINCLLQIVFLVIILYSIAAIQFALYFLILKKKIANI